MESVRPPAVAGLFYPADTGALESAVAGYLAEARAEPAEAAPEPPKALIVPHAGFVYSGPVAASAYALSGPTVFGGVKNDMTVAREEIFGPVCHVAPFASEDQAVTMANDSSYGLAAAIWTTNLARAHRVARQIDAGIVWVNTWYLRDLRTPFGGVKLSGIGREGGDYALDFHSDLKTLQILESSVH